MYSDLTSQSWGGQWHSPGSPAGLQSAAGHASHWEVHNDPSEGGKIYVVCAS